MTDFLFGLEAGSLPFTQFIMNYFLHSSLFIFAAIISLRMGLINADRRGELIMKLAFVLGLVSASFAHVDLTKPGGADNRLVWQVTPNVTQKSLDSDKDARESSPATEKAVQTSQKAKSNDAVNDVENPIARTDSSATETESRAANSQQQTMPAVTSNVDNGRGNATSVSSDTDDINSITSLLMFYWICGLVVMLLVRLYQYTRLKGLLRDRRQVTDDDLVNALHEIKAKAAIKQPITLFQCDVITSPIALNQREIIIPSNLLAEYSYEQKYAALAHELAHLKRGDMRWQNFSVFLETLLYVQPLNRILKKETVQLIEQRTDQLAATWTGNPRALAEALSVAAKINLEQKKSHLRHTEWVMAMKSEKSNLMKRVEQLIVNPIAKTKNTSMYLLTVIALSLAVSAPSMSLQQMIVPSNDNVVVMTKDELKDMTIKAEQVDILPDGTYVFTGDFTITPDNENTEPSDSLAEATSDSHAENEHDGYFVTEPDKGSSHYSTSSDYQDGFGGEGTHSFSHIEEDDGVNKLKITTENDRRSLSIKAVLDGQIVFNAEETEIESFPPDSHMDIRYSDDDFKKRMRIRRNDGAISYEYFEHNQPADLERGQRWLAELIPEILRITGWHAKERVKRLYANNGAIAVLNEIKRIQSDHVRSVYFEHLLHSAMLTSDELELAIAMTRKLESDFQQRKVLTTIVQAQMFSDETWLQVLAATKGIQSDAELSSFLEVVLSKLPNAQKLHMAYFDATRSIESDFELANMLVSLIDDIELSSELRTQVLLPAVTIQSDFELARLLIAMSKSMQFDDRRTNERFMEVAATIQSDFEMRRVMNAVLDQPIDHETLTMVLELSATEIQSDYELSQTLIKVIDQQYHNLGYDQRSRQNMMREAMQSIQSTHERSRVEQALVDAA